MMIVLEVYSPSAWCLTIWFYNAVNVKSKSFPRA
jgi:hypothetical protein